MKSTSTTISRMLEALPLLFTIFGICALLPLRQFLDQWVASWYTHSEAMLHGITAQELLIQKTLVYQGVSLVMTLILLSLMYITAKLLSHQSPDQSLYHSMRGYIQNLYATKGAGQKDAPVIPVPWLGITPKDGENWSHIGRNFAIILTTITCIVVYMQTHAQNISVGNMSMGNAQNIQDLQNNIHNNIYMQGIAGIAWAVGCAILCAVCNAFVEEALFRFSFVAFDGIWPRRIIYVLGAGVFGIIHYFGAPGGIAGVLMASFLGFLLTKSMLETRGIYWAWLLHGLQDVAIFTILFVMAQ